MYKRQIQFFLPRAHTIDRSELEAFIDAHKVPVTITEDHTYDLMQICDVCLAASGKMCIRDSCIPTEGIS